MGRGANDLSKPAEGPKARPQKKHDRFCPVYGIPAEARRQIQAWVESLPWDEGAELQDPRKYHVTAIFSPIGLADESNHEWLAERAKAIAETPFTVRAVAVETFTPQPGELQPIVIRLGSPELIAANERLMDEAEARGLEVSRFEGGYKPHITVGFNPTGFAAEPPELEFEISELSEINDYYVKTGYKTAAQ